jgi:hypothetical protein
VTSRSREDYCLRAALYTIGQHLNTNIGTSTFCSLCEVDCCRFRGGTGKRTDIVSASSKVLQSLALIMTHNKDQMDGPQLRISPLHSGDKI